MFLLKALKIALPEPEPERAGVEFNNRFVLDIHRRRVYAGWAGAGEANPNKHAWTEPAIVATTSHQLGHAKKVNLIF